MSGTWIPGPLGDDTALVHAGVSPDAATGGILTPIHQSTTFVQESIDKRGAARTTPSPNRRGPSRVATPTRPDEL